MTVYVDVLAAPDYLVVDTLSFDDAFWSQNQAQLNADAAKYGKELSPRTAAPNFAATPIMSIPEFDARMQLADAGPAPGVTAPTTGSDIPGGAVALGLFAVGGTLAWLLTR